MARISGIALLVIGTWIAPVSGQAAGEGFLAACDHDALSSSEEVAGRNAWAYNCGYIDKEDEGWNSARSKYAIFVNYIAPVGADEPCVGRDVLFGFCNMK